MYYPLVSLGRFAASGKTGTNAPAKGIAEKCEPEATDFKSGALSAAISFSTGHLNLSQPIGPCANAAVAIGSRELLQHEGYASIPIPFIVPIVKTTRLADPWFYKCQGRQIKHSGGHVNLATQLQFHKLVKFLTNIFGTKGVTVYR
jgi:hypothetical protein